MNTLETVGLAREGLRERLRKYRIGPELAVKHKTNRVLTRSVQLAQIRNFKDLGDHYKFNNHYYNYY